MVPSKTCEMPATFSRMSPINMLMVSLLTNVSVTIGVQHLNPIMLGNNYK